MFAELIITDAEAPPELVAKPEFSDAKKAIRQALLSIDQATLMLSGIVNDLQGIRASLVTTLLSLDTLTEMIKEA